MKFFIWFLLISVLISLSNFAFCQISEKELKKIPENFAHFLLTRENQRGVLMSYKQFKRGNFVEANDTERGTFMTTMLLGSGTFLYDYLSNQYPDFKPLVIQPNGFTRTSFKIKYLFNEDEIFIMRIMDKKKAGLDPLAAENPENYLLLYGFDIDDESKLNLIMDVLIQHLTDTNTYYERGIGR